jgi:HK97 family phage prohead protease
MPWTYDEPPAVAENWTEAEQRRCVDAANAVLEEGGSDEEAIYACIAAAGKVRAHHGQGGAMAKKTFHAPIVLKEDGEEGTFKSVFAQFNVIDHDGDVTQPGAFLDGAEAVVEGWNHDWGLPVGKGVIHSNEREAWIEGRFFLDTVQGKDHYLTLKNLEGLEEWSYTFDIEEAEFGEFDGQQVQFLKRLDVWGVAPVTRGAGIGTRTVTLKAAPQLTEEETARLLAKIRDSSDSEGGEGETGTDGEPSDDGKPSGVPPSVVRTQIDIMQLEE